MACSPISRWRRPSAFAVAEAILDKALRRPWHGACDRAAHPDVVALRLHRAEVTALLAYRRIPERSREQADAWRRCGRGAAR